MLLKIRGWRSDGIVVGHDNLCPDEIIRQLTGNSSTKPSVIGSEVQVHSTEESELSGFSKISFEELKGVVGMLKLFGSLPPQSQESVMLIMDGLKYRAENKK